MKIVPREVFIHLKMLDKITIPREENVIISAHKHHQTQ
jgi:hypothetical protein